jgi:putative oligomerization/nucleic acid binding protein
MNTLVLEGIAFVAVVSSLGLAALVVMVSSRSHATPPAHEAPAPPASDSGNATETMSRVLSEIERLAALRDRGVLTAKEFATQKGKLLESQTS